VDLLVLEFACKWVLVPLTEGYHAIDSELALPTIRQHVEKQLNLIAEGKADHGAVVAHTLRQFTVGLHSLPGGVRVVTWSILAVIN
jgi:DNA topoisomerase IA